MEKKLDGNNTKMLWAVLNKSWKKHPTKQQLYGHLPPITKTIKVRRTRHVGHCWRSKDDLISDVLLRRPSYGRAKEGQLVKTYMQQICAETECCLEDLPGAIDDKGGERGSRRSVQAAQQDDRIYMIWFGWVLWYISHCMLFNAKSCSYIYIKYI